MKKICQRPSFVVLFLLTLGGVLIFCGGPFQEDVSRQPHPIPPIQLKPQNLKIDGNLKSFKAGWESRTESTSIQIITLTLESEKAATPPEFTVKWRTPSIDVFGFWSPNISLDKSSYWSSRTTSRAARYAPVISLYNQQDTNRITLAVSDTLNKVVTGAYLKEEDVNFHFYVNFFSEKTPSVKRYQVQFRIDTRPLHFSQILRDTARWWAAMPDQKPAPVPEFARLPLYSTWYSFHQNITADEVVKQCHLAKPLGFDVLIVDDGWQTLDSQRGYRFTGDWEPIRIGDMKNFVKRVHQSGIKFMLWYSLPFIGERAKNYTKFKGKYLSYWESQGTWVLDPRYPDVREYIINTYEKALKEWKLDGFKLDFMGWFRADKNTLITAANGRDFASVDQAVDKLMTEIMTRLRDINPQIMIEFRQPYIGPRMRKYGNMFRATDCPNMALINRVRITDIRLLCDNTAVHSDMYVWHGDEPVEQSALQLLNVLFSVPQLSVKLDKVSSPHLRMIKFWTQYWKSNRSVFLDGTFIPSGPNANYPIIRGRTAEKTIIAVYNNVTVPIDKYDQGGLDIVNGKMSAGVVIDAKIRMGKRQIKIFNCQGYLEYAKKMHIKPGVTKFAVPPSGLVVISGEEE